MAVARVWDADNGVWQVIGEGQAHVVDPVEPDFPVDGMIWTNPAEDTARPYVGTGYGAAKHTTTVQSILWSTWTTINLSAGTDPKMVWDFGGYFNVGTPGRFTVPAGLGGRHLITFSAEFLYFNGGARSLRILANAAVINLLAESGAMSVGGVNWRGSIDIELMLAAGDTIDFQVWHASSGTLANDMTAARASILRTGGSP